jgi:hypothetical protein
MFNSFHYRIDIVLTKDNIHTLANIVIANQHDSISFFDLVHLNDSLPPMHFNPKNEAIVTDTPLINSSH